MCTGIHRSRTGHYGTTTFLPQGLCNTSTTLGALQNQPPSILYAQLRARTEELLCLYSFMAMPPLIRVSSVRDCGLNGPDARKIFVAPWWPHDALQVRVRTTNAAIKTMQLYHAETQAR